MCGATLAKPPKMQKQTVLKVQGEKKKLILQFRWQSRTTTIVDGGKLDIFQLRILLHGAIQVSQGMQGALYFTFFSSYPTLSGACFYFLTLSCVTALLHPMAATYNPPCPCPSKQGRSGVEQGPRMLEPSSPGTARPVILAGVVVLPLFIASPAQGDSSPSMSMRRGSSPKCFLPLRGGMAPQPQHQCHSSVDENKKKNGITSRSIHQCLWIECLYLGLLLEQM